MKKIQFPLSVVMLVAMIFAWKTALQWYFPNSRLSIISYEPKVEDPFSLTVLKLRGKVELSNGAEKSLVVLGQTIKKPWMIRTFPDSVLTLGYGEGFASQIKVGPNSVLNLSNYKEKGFKINEGLFFDLQNGVMLFKIANQTKKKIVKVRTPVFSMGIRSATFMVEANDDKSLVLVKEGSVELDSRGAKFKIAHSGFGFSATSENDIEQVEIKNYSVEWDTNSETPTAPPAAKEVKLVPVDLNSTLEEEIAKLSKAYEERRIKNDQLKKENEAKITAIEDDLQRLSQDRACLENLMKDCSFISSKFKDDVANLKNNPTRLTTNLAIKINLKKDMAAERANLEQQKLNVKVDMEQEEKEFQSETVKLTTVKAKFEELKTVNEAKRNDRTKELVDLIDTSSIKEAAKKAGL